MACTPPACLLRAGDLAHLELRPGLDDAASVLSAESASRERCRLGGVERDFGRLVHSNLYNLRLSLPACAAETASVLGHDHRDTAIHSAALCAFHGASFLC